MQALIHMRAIREANRAAGQHWFEPATMRFFNSRVPRRNCYPCDARKCTYFVSSEQFTDRYRGFSEPRKFTVRAASWETGGIDTVGEFQAYATRGAAERAARAFATCGTRP